MNFNDIKASIIGFEYNHKSTKPMRPLEKCIIDNEKIHISIYVRVRLKRYIDENICLYLYKTNISSDDSTVMSLNLLEVNLSKDSIEKGESSHYNELPFDEYPIVYQFTLNAMDIPSPGPGKYAIVISDANNRKNALDIHYFDVVEK